MENYEFVKSKLEKIKNCIRNGKYKVTLNTNRKENIFFMKQQKVDEVLRVKILLSLEIEDFCYSCNNTNKGYEYEKLYIFSKTILLQDISDTYCDVTVYFKFNIIESGKDMVIVISFHKLNKPIYHPFK